MSSKARISSFTRYASLKSNSIPSGAVEIKLHAISNSRAVIAGNSAGGATVAVGASLCLFRFRVELTLACGECDDRTGGGGGIDAVTPLIAGSGMLNVDVTIEFTCPASLVSDIRLPGIVIKLAACFSPSINVGK